MPLTAIELLALNQTIYQNLNDILLFSHDEHPAPLDEHGQKVNRVRLNGGHRSRHGPILPDIPALLFMHGPVEVPIGYEPQSVLECQDCHPLHPIQPGEAGIRSEQVYLGGCKFEV
jgi:hypothetical protein